MKHPRVHHDRERFNTPWSSKPFAIMKTSPGKPGKPGEPAAAGRGHQTTLARLRHAAKPPYVEHLHNTRNAPASLERHMR
jgi:hypothetical protein